MMASVEMLCWLIVGHALADYPLQGDFLARCKSHHTGNAEYPWWLCLFMHAAIHGGMVAVVTGSLACGIAETVIHACIDCGKCDGRFGFVTDQILHLLCKVLWVAALRF